MHIGGPEPLYRASARDKDVTEEDHSPNAMSRGRHRWQGLPAVGIRVEGFHLLEYSPWIPDIAVASGRRGSVIARCRGIFSPRWWHRRPAAPGVRQRRECSWPP